MKSLTRVLLSLFTMALAGCQSEKRDSLHQMEHVTPAHWPSNLNDAADKIGLRLKQLQASGTEQSSTEKMVAARKELFEIVGWIPEIAADSFINESQWVPVNEASLKLSERLQRMPSAIDTETEKELTSFMQLLVKTAQLEAENRPTISEAPSSNEPHAPDSKTDKSDESES